MVSGKSACTARSEVTRSNTRHESVHRRHCRGLISPEDETGG
jgi:hypothetical protein